AAATPRLSLDAATGVAEIELSYAPALPLAREMHAAVAELRGWPALKAVLLHCWGDQPGDASEVAGEVEDVVRGQRALEDAGAALQCLGGVPVIAILGRGAGEAQCLLASYSDLRCAAPAATVATELLRTALGRVALVGPTTSASACLQHGLADAKHLLEAGFVHALHTAEEGRRLAASIGALPAVASTLRGLRMSGCLSGERLGGPVTRWSCTMATEDALKMEAEPATADAARAGPHVTLPPAASTVSARDTRGTGIHTIEAYVPRHCTKAVDLETHHKAAGKYTVGLEQQEYGCVGDDEDTVSMALTVVKRLMERHQIAYKDVGMLAVGSETLLDRSKSIKSNLMQLFEAHGCYNVEGVDSYHACYGTTATLFNAINWVQSASWDGRWAIVVGSDVSDASSKHKYSFLVGAGAVAMLVGPDAPVQMESVRVTHMMNRWDFFKPVGWKTMAAVVDGPHSMDMYMECLDSCQQQLTERCGLANIVDDHDYLVYHLGSSPKFVRKAFTRTMANIHGKDVNEELVKQAFDEKVAPSLELAARIGPMHTVATYMNLLSLFVAKGDQMQGRSVCVFSYGSGSAASMFRLRVDSLPELGGDIRAQLDGRIVHSAEFFERICDTYAQTYGKFGWKPKVSMDRCGDTYYLTSTDVMNRRVYTLTAPSTPLAHSTARLPPLSPPEPASMNTFGCGIHAIEAYVPRHCTKAVDLETHHKAAGKYTVGLEQQEYGCVGDDEDTVSMALTVVKRLMERHQIAYKDVGMLAVGSETLLDRSKSIKSNLMQLFEAHGCYNVEGVDSYHACYGTTATLFNAINWVQSASWDGRWAIVVGSDVSDASSKHKYSFLVGAGAVAMLVGPDAPVQMESVRVTHMMNRWDFFKPVGWKTMAAVVDGPHSMDMYMECLDSCQQQLTERCGLANIVDDHDYLVYHLGSSPKFVRKAFTRTMANIHGKDVNEELVKRAFDEKVAPSLELAARIGPMHTVATYMNLLSLFVAKGDQMQGRSVCVFSYGSGSAASMFRLRVDSLPELGGDIRAQLDGRIVHSAEFFERICDTYAQTYGKFGWKPVDAGAHRVPATFYLKEVGIMGKRAYEECTRRCLKYYESAAPPMAASDRQPISRRSSSRHSSFSQAQVAAYGARSRSASTSQSTEEVQARVQRVADSMLGSVTSPETPLMDAGLDSLGIQELRHRLQQEFPSAELPDTMVAVVGMACRFPGDASTPASLWERLCAGHVAPKQVPIERWDVDAVNSRQWERFNESAAQSMRFAACLSQDSVELFDQTFFGVSVAEASGMDPQQRLLLTVGYEALADAGHTREALRGSSTGVFIGLSGVDFAHLRQQQQAQSDRAYAYAGGANSAAAGRISHLLGLHGPCQAMDTACSSSMVALHTARRSLQLGECRSALVAGVNLILTPSTATRSFAAAGMLSPTGQCHALDAAADGYVRAEGCGALCLKRLRDAVADGDTVHAVVRGSSVMHDGQSATLTAPNGAAQQRLLSSALADAGVSAAQVSYVEAHGTGTALGDPTEIAALAAVFGEPRPLGEVALAVGTLKGNLGHMEPCAGVGGVIKAVMALRHRRVPGAALLNTLNPLIAKRNSELATPFNFLVGEGAVLRPAGGADRVLAGVTSLGAYGTIAHVVLEEAPADLARLRDTAPACCSQPERFPLHPDGPVHRLLQRRHVQSGGSLYYCALRGALLRLAAGHRVRSAAGEPAVMLSGAWYIEMALAALLAHKRRSAPQQGAARQGEPAVCLAGVRHVSACAVPADKSRTEVQLRAELNAEGTQVVVCSRELADALEEAENAAADAEAPGSRKGGTREHIRVTGMLLPEADLGTESLEEIRQRCTGKVSVGDFYGTLRGAGLELSGDFRAVQQLWRAPGGQEALARVPPGDLSRGFLWGPARIDGSFQVAYACSPAAATGELRVVLGAELVVALATPPESDAVWWVHAVRQAEAAERCTVDVAVMDEAGRVFLQMRALELRPATAEPHMAPAGSPHVLRSLNLPVAAASSQEAPQSHEAESGIRGELRAQLTSMEAAQQQAYMEKLVLEVAVSVVTEEVSLTSESPLMEAGVDSIAATELLHALKGRTGLHLASSLIFDFPTVHAIASHLLEELQLTTALPGTAPFSKPLAPKNGEKLSRDPLQAVVGVACELPAGRSTPAEYWEQLAAAGDAVREVPITRWNADLVDTSRLAPHAAAGLQFAAFVDALELFDERYFNLSAAEAVTMDPQQRLLLELGNASLCQGAGAGAISADTGVFVGISGTEFASLMVHGQERHSAYSVTGCQLSVAAGRISFVLGLQGPCLAVDTACAASLVALGCAQDSLRGNAAEPPACSNALVAGVNVMLLPSSMHSLAVAGMLASDGRCKTFDDRADGYGRGEGCGAAVLQPLDAMEEQACHVHAMLAGVAVRQDGRSASLTAPNGIAQQTVLRAGLRAARLHPAQMTMLEAHGTGTALGDPVEVRAVVVVLRSSKSPASQEWRSATNPLPPLVIGSAKANHGHLEPGAGAAGLLKTILQLSRQCVAPNAQLRTLSPHVAEHLEPQASAMVFPVAAGGCHTLHMSGTSGGDSQGGGGGMHGRKGLAAGLSAFGFSGTIAHAVVLQGPLPRAGGSASNDNPRLGVPGPQYERRALPWGSPVHWLLQRQHTTEVEGSQGAVQVHTAELKGRILGRLLQHHTVGEQAVVSTSVLSEMALAAIAQRRTAMHGTAGACAALLDVHYVRPAALGTAAALAAEAYIPLHLECRLEPGGGGAGGAEGGRMVLRSRDLGQGAGVEGIQLAYGRIGVWDGAAPASLDEEARAQARARCPEVLEAEEVYKVVNLEARRQEFRGPLCTVQRLWAGPREALAELALPAAAEGICDGFGAAGHPALTDGAMQTVMFAAGLHRPGPEAASGEARVLMPAEVACIEGSAAAPPVLKPAVPSPPVSAEGMGGQGVSVENVGQGEIFAHVRVLEHHERRSCTVDIVVADRLGRVMLAMHRLVLRELSASQMVGVVAAAARPVSCATTQQLYEARWAAAPVPETLREAPLRILVLAEPCPLAAAMWAAAPPTCAVVEMSASGDSLSDAGTTPIDMAEALRDDGAAPYSVELGACPAANAGALGALIAARPWHAVVHLSSCSGAEDEYADSIEIRRLVVQAMSGRCEEGKAGVAAPVLLLLGLGRSEVRPHCARSVTGGVKPVAAHTAHAPRSALAKLRAAGGAVREINIDAAAYGEESGHAAARAVWQAAAEEAALVSRGADEVEGFCTNVAYRGGERLVATVELVEELPALPALPLLRKDASYLIVGRLDTLTTETSTMLQNAGAGCIILCLMRGPSGEEQAACAPNPPASDGAPRTRSGRALTRAGLLLGRRQDASDALRERRAQSDSTQLQMVEVDAASLESAAGLRVLTERLCRLPHPLRGALLLDLLPAQALGGLHSWLGTSPFPLDFNLVVSMPASPGMSEGPSEGRERCGTAELPEMERSHTARQQLQGGGAAAHVVLPAGQSSGESGSMSVQQLCAALGAAVGQVTRGKTPVLEVMSRTASEAAAEPLAPASSRMLLDVSTVVDGTASGAHPGRGQLAVQLLALAAQERQEAIEALVLEAAQQVVGSEEVEVNSPLMQAGIDSIGTTELQTLLSQRTGVQLLGTFMFEYPTVQALAHHILVQMLPDTTHGSNKALLRRVQSAPTLAPARGPFASPAGACPADPALPPHSELAIIGMACRLPGRGGAAASAPKAYWGLLETGYDAVGKVPYERWTVDESNARGLSPEAAQSMQRASFLPRLELFDAKFFSIGVAEALQMDPQQRLTLEVGYEALRRGGFCKDTLLGTPTGVFLGVCQMEFAFLAGRPVGPYTAAGAALSVGPGRLAYTLGLEGPCEAIDAACASAVVALHNSATAVHLAECTMAVAGGVNAMLAPRTTYSLAAAGMLAGDGRCKTFDAGADGYGRGEGCGVVVLTSQRTGQGGGVYALLAGSAVRQDGCSASLTAPHGAAQQAVLLAAAAAAQRRLGELSVVEAHGTGTALGDPTEVGAMLGALRASTKDPYGGDSVEAPVLVGSAKANHGHLESGAGAAGLLKLIFSLRAESCAPNAQLRTLNPFIMEHLHRGAHTPLSFPKSTAATAPALLTLRGSGPPSPLLGGLSSFGFNGTLSHAIVSQSAVTRGGEAAWTDPSSVYRPQRYAWRPPSFRMLPELRALGGVPGAPSTPSPASPWGSRAALPAELAAFAEGFVVHGRAQLPTSVYVEALLAMAARLRSNGGGGAPQPGMCAEGLRLKDVECSAVSGAPAHRLGEDPAAAVVLECQSSVGPGGAPEGGPASKEVGLRVMSSSVLAESAALPESPAVLRASCTLVAGRAAEAGPAPEAPPEPVACRPPAGAVELTGAHVYAELQKRGVEYTGVHADVVAGLWVAKDGDAAGAVLSVPSDAVQGGFVVHPSILEGVAVLAGVAAARQGGTEMVALSLVKAEEVEVMGWMSSFDNEVEAIVLGVRADPAVGGAVRADVSLAFAESGAVSVSLQGCCFMPVQPAGAASRGADGADDPWRVYQVQWLPSPLMGNGRPSAAEQGGRDGARWLILVLGADESSDEELNWGTELGALRAEGATEVARVSAFLREGRLPDGNEVRRRCLQEAWGAVLVLVSRDGAETAAGAPTTAAAAIAMQTVVRALLDVCAAAGQSPAATRAPDVYAITCGATAEGGAAPMAVSQGGVFGLVHTLETEMEAQSLGMKVAGMDVDAWSVASAEGVWREICAASAESHVALRRGERYVARVVSACQVAALQAEGEDEPGTFTGRKAASEELETPLTTGAKAEAEAESVSVCLHRSCIDFAALLAELSSSNVHQPEALFAVVGDPTNAEYTAMERYAQALLKEAFTALTPPERASLLPEHARLLGCCESPSRFMIEQALPPSAALEPLLPDRAEARLMRHVAPHLLDVFRRETDSVSVLFPQSNIDLVRDFYENAPSALYLNNLLRSTVDFLLASRRKGPGSGSGGSTQRLRVLEVGAGTGASTAAMMPALASSGCAVYTFTDIGPTFLGKAAERFAAYDFVEYRTLDISRDPALQGFDRGSYDLVVATNVLHATPDLEVTMTHCRQLLVPGGVVMVNEAVRHFYTLDVTYGLTAGWWAFTDTHRRDVCLMSQEQWRTLLRDTNFLQPHTFPDHTNAPQAVILAQKPAMAPVHAPPGRLLSAGTPHNACVVVWDASGLPASGLAECVARLLLAGRRARHVVLAVPEPRPERLARAREGLERCGAEVHLYGLEGAEGRTEAVGLMQHVRSTLGLQTLGVVYMEPVHSPPGSSDDATDLAAPVWQLHTATLADPLELFLVVGTHCGGLCGASASAGSYIQALVQWRNARSLHGAYICADRTGLIDTAVEEDAAYESLKEELQLLARLALGALGEPPHQPSGPLGLGPMLLSGRRATWRMAVTQAGGRRVPKLLSAVCPRVARSAAAPKSAEGAGTAAHQEGEDMEQWLQALSRQEQVEYLEGLVLSTASTIMGGALDATLDTPLQETGLDSLALQEMTRTLREHVGIQLPGTLVFEFPNARALAAHLLTKLAPADALSLDTVTLAAPSQGPASRLPVAVSGAACRFPGARASEVLAGFLQLTRAGKNVVREVPAERWVMERVDASFLEPRMIEATRHAHWLADVEWFDSAFFGISAAEALELDPQQRVLLEVSYDSLADAGHSKPGLAGAQIGVFVGISTAEFAFMTAFQGGGPGPFTLSGGSLAMASGRISYCLGLHGPCLSTDTACSSALVAFSTGLTNVQSGACSSAVAGGVSLMTDPQTPLVLAAGGFLAPDGRCKTFDAGADGYGRGEGCGSVVLAVLPAAAGEHDASEGARALATVLGGAVAQDGRSASITAPNGSAQQALLRRTLVQSGVATSSISLVEAHGT
ncbi:hypothetical protein CYMTET_36729, partial [Cymbomonas tetramitiformis]